MEYTFIEKAADLKALLERWKADGVTVVAMDF